MVAMFPAVESQDMENPETLPLTDAQKDELERRWRALEANPDEGESWETLKKTLLAQVPLPARGERVPRSGG